MHNFEHKLSKINNSKSLGGDSCEDESYNRQIIIACPGHYTMGGDLGRLGGRPPNLRWGDGPCIRPPKNI